CALASSLGRDFLPKRFGRSMVLRDFPMDAAREIMRWLTPPDSSIVEAAFTPSGLLVRRTDATERMLESTDALVEEINGIRAGIGRYFVPSDGFPEVERINWLDGVRVRFASGDVAHFRPSGNAPEMRFYSNADTAERAADITRLGIADDGILRHMARDAADRMAIASYRASPRPLPLFGVVQHYAWGGRELIPGLLGIENGGNQPFAELWMGAHPRGTAQVEVDGTRITLDRLIAADPWLTLGHE